MDVNNFKENEFQQLANFLLANFKKYEAKKEIPNERITIDTELLQNLFPFMGWRFNPYFKYIDLSSIFLDNMDVRGLNFEGSNVNIDVQMVRDKSLYRTNLRGLDLSKLDFTGANIECANLEDTNANIDPTLLAVPSLWHTNLRNVDLTGKSFKGIWISYANLENTNAEIDPYEIKNGGLCGTNLNGCTLHYRVDSNGIVNSFIMDENTMLEHVNIVYDFATSLDEAKHYIKTLFPSKNSY